MVNNTLQVGTTKSYQNQFVKSSHSINTMDARSAQAVSRTSVSPVSRSFNGNIGSNNSFVVAGGKGTPSEFSERVQQESSYFKIGA
jgi:hypothetical protein